MRGPAILPAVSRGRRTGEAWPLAVPLTLALLAASLYFLAASARDFWAPDEPDFAQHVREMLERRSLLLPYQNGVPYSEKPILFYWAMAATTVFSGGDLHPTAVRLPSVLACAFLVFGSAALAGWRGGRREALTAGSMTGVATLVFWQGQFLQIDAFFTALVFAALLCQFFVGTGSKGAGPWLWAFHVSLALAVLTKGPLAIVLSGLVAASRAVVQRSIRPIAVLRPVRGALVVLGIVVPWYLLAARAGGSDYAYDLIVNQNWNRFTAAFDHAQPWYFYLVSIWSDFAPWTPLAIAAPIVLARSGTFRRRPELGFSWLVFVVSLVFLSISESKQGKYLLVAYPFLAVLVAAAISDVEAAAARRSGWLVAFRGYVGLVGVLLVGSAVALGPLARQRFPEYAGLAPAVAIPLAAGGLITVLVLIVRRTEVAPGVLALCLALFAGEVAVARVVFPAVDVPKTGRPFYERIRPLVSNGEPLAYFGYPYRSYAILVLRRKTEHVITEAELVRWARATRGAYVLADVSESAKWHPETHALFSVVDRQPVGQDEVQLLVRR